MDNSASGVEHVHMGAKRDQAEQLARKALEAKPDDLRAIMLLGVIAGKKGQFEECENLFRRALNLDPDSFPARMWLTIALRNQGRLAEALCFAEQAAKQNTNDANAQLQLGLTLLELDRYREAEAAIRQSAALEPNNARAYEALGRALHGPARKDESIDAFRKAVQLEPNNAHMLQRLGAALLEGLESAEAVQCARKVLQLNPDSRQGRMLLARALAAAQKGDEAAEVITQLANEAPNWGLAWLIAGQILQVVGRFDEAQAYFQRAVELVPAQGQAYLGMVQGRRLGSADHELIQRMQSMIDNAALRPEELRSLHAALGKAYDDVRDYERAMNHLDLAHRIEHEARYGGERWDREEAAAAVDRTIDLFRSSFLSKHRGIGLEDETPLFVVGMIRSGTTLTDQILSSHPKIGTVGEQPFWLWNHGQALNLFEGSLDLARLKTLAIQYKEMLNRLSPGKERVVDKLPGNYMALGLIYLAYPNARVIHLNRHPVDTCISIYATPNSVAVPWVHDKGDIVFHYKLYLRLMDHWRRVFPPSHILDVRYEELVTEPERVSRMMVEFAGLEWSERCLKPEDNVRSVTTPSTWQVRQPVHTGSTERWRKYEPWLGEFRELLEPGGNSA